LGRYYAAMDKADKAPTAPVLALVGMPGSGKSTAAEMLAARGWATIRFGQVTIDEIAARGLTVDERNERAIREELRRVHGPDAYARLAMPKILAARETGRVLIDGLYSWSEYKYLHEALASRMLVLAITSARRIRYARLAGRSERPLTAEEARRRDFAEVENLEKGGPIAMADYTIVNDAALDDLRREVDRAIAFLFPS